MLFAHAIFNMHKNMWQIRQISGADKAINFWRHVISKYTNNNYQDEITDDSDWGIVTKQTFTNI